MTLTTKKLSEFGIPFLETVLFEIFLILPTTIDPEQIQPDTLDDLMKLAFKMKPDEVKRRFLQIAKLAQGSVTDFDKTGSYCFVNVETREENFFPFSEEEKDNCVWLHGLEDIPEFFENNKNTKIYIYSRSPERSFSACMFFREKGHLNTFALC